MASLLALVFDEPEHHSGARALEQKSSQFFHVYVHMVCMHVCMYVTELVNMCVQMCEMCLCLWRFKVGVLCPPRSQWFTLHIEPRACCWLFSLYSLPCGVSVSSEL